MLKIFLPLLFCFVSIVAGSQDDGSTDVSDKNKYGIMAGYSAYLITNPGFQVGIEHPLASMHKFTLLANLTLRAYYEGEIQSGILLNVGYGSRVTVPFGLFFENYIRIGYEHYFYTNKTYTFNNGVAHIEESKENKPAVSPDISIGVGYDFSKISPLGLLLFVRPTLAWRIPDRNLVFQNTFSIDAGFIWYPKMNKSK